MSAEILRRAASQMRERAEAVDPEARWLRLGQLTGEFNVPTAAHIASWHPAAALAVADWLDACALVMDVAPSSHKGNALAVARTYLGRDS